MNRAWPGATTPTRRTALVLARGAAPANRRSAVADGPACARLSTSAAGAALACGANHTQVQYAAATASAPISAKSSAIPTAAGARCAAWRSAWFDRLFIASDSFQTYRLLLLHQSREVP